MTRYRACSHGLSGAFGHAARRSRGCAAAGPPGGNARPVSIWRANEQLANRPEGVVMGEREARRAGVGGAGGGGGRAVPEHPGAAGAGGAAVARSAGARGALAPAPPPIRAEVADATDATAAGVLLERHHPDILALV